MIVDFSGNRLLRAYAVDVRKAEAVYFKDRTADLGDNGDIVLSLKI